jgi:hypothetical protein
MEFNVINLKNYLEGLLEQYDGIGDALIKIVIPDTGSYLLTTPKALDVAHSPNEKPYIAFVMDDFETIKAQVEKSRLIIDNESGETLNS